MHSRRWAAALLILFLAIPTFAAKNDDSEVADLKAEIAALETQLAELGTKIDAHFAALDKKLADIAAGPEQKEAKARQMLGQVNQAIAKARQMHVEAMKSVTSDLDLPGLDDAFMQLTPDGPPSEGP